MAATIKLKRGLSASWAEKNLILEVGEPGYELDTHRLKIGDGVTPWNDLDYIGGIPWGIIEDMVDEKADKDDVYTKDDIDELLTAIYIYKGSVDFYDELPAEGQRIGDAWNIRYADYTHGIKAGDNVVWNGEEWDVHSGDIDLSNKQDKLIGTKGQVVSFDDDGNAIAIDGETTTEIPENVLLGNLKNYTKKIELPNIDDKDQLNSLVYGNGKILCFMRQYITTGGKINKLYHSVNGIKWIKINIPENIVPLLDSSGGGNIKFQDGKFIIFSADRLSVAISKDGIEWNVIELTWPDSDYNINHWGLIFAKDLIYAYNYNIQKIYYSQDGLSWMNIDIPYKGMLEYFNNKFIIGTENRELYQSEDFIDWEKINYPEKTIQGNIFYSVIQNVGDFLIFQTVIATSNSMELHMIYTNDLINWEELVYPNNDNNSNIMYAPIFLGEEKFLAVKQENPQSKYGYNLIFSSNGIDWTNTNIYMHSFGEIVYADNKFIAYNLTKVINDDDIQELEIGYSYDGIEWFGTSDESYIDSITFNDDTNITEMIAERILSYHRDEDHSNSYYTKNEIKEELKMIGATKNADGIGGFVPTPAAGKQEAVLRGDGTWSNELLTFEKVNTKIYPFGYGDFRLFKICYGNGKFVAVGNNEIKYSTDGKIWFDSYIPKSISNADWISICYGADKFVAVDMERGDIIQSIDGITWEKCTSSPGRKLTSICYGKGKFVTTCETNYVYYSTDATNWTSSRVSGVSSSTALVNIDYINGRFVISAYDKYTCYSDDGIKWSYKYDSKKIEPDVLCYSNDKYVMIETNPDRTIKYSTDGLTWNNATLDSSITRIYNMQSICYGNGKFVVVGSDIIYSNDGETWFAATRPKNVDCLSVCYNNGKFIAVGYNGNIIYSDDGETWIDVTQSTKGKIITPWKAMAYGNGQYVIVGDNNIAYSNDGYTWTNSNVYSNEYYKSICYENDKFVAISENTVNYSIDGKIWTKIDKVGGKTICYGNNKFVIGGTKIKYSTDGLIWNDITVSGGTLSNYLDKSLCYGNGKFIAISNKDVAYSTDGETWTLIKDAFSSQGYYKSIAYGNNKYVAVGSDCKFAYSEDGEKWTTGNLPSAGSMGEYKSICYGNGKFVAISTDSKNKVVYSTDGINWQVSSFTIPSTIMITHDNYVNYINNKFVIISPDNKMMAYSTDGINWTNSYYTYDSIMFDNTNVTKDIIDIINYYGHFSREIETKQDKLIGKEGQIVGFDETGNTIPIDYNTIITNLTNTISNLENRLVELEERINSL